MSNNVPDFLNQSDIDRMLAEAVEESRAPMFRANGEPFGPADVPVEPFDFRTPIFLAEAELRRLRIVHQEFIRALSARFSSFLRADFNFKMSKLTTLPYDKFAETINNPSHLTLFKVDPLPGIAVLEIQPRLAMNMANRMLGGKGLSGESERYLTEIEIALLEEVVAIITAEWCNQWREETNLAPKMLGNETNARFLQICPKDTVILVLAMEVQAGESAETLQIGVPYHMIEPVVKRMQGSRMREVEGTVLTKNLSWRSSYDDINIPIVADWPVTELALADIARLRAGDILKLPVDVVEKTRLRVANTTQFIGRAGRENGRVAVQVNTRVAV